MMPLRIRINNGLMKAQIDSEVPSLLLLFKTWKLIFRKISDSHWMIDYFGIIVIQIHGGSSFFRNSFRICF